MSFIIKFINLVLYSNAWIALAALCSVTQTLLFLKNDQSNFSLSIFVFSSTLFIYALHRIVGLKKVKPFQEKGRYLVIATFKSHIIIYAILAGVIAFVSFFLLSWKLQLALIIPALISLTYVLPVLNSNRRLRDIHFIKIFLIAIVWAWVSVILAAFEVDYPIDKKIVWMFAERALFIFAITLPFDIRDLQIDNHAAVKTIPSIIGIKNAKLLALGVLVVMLFCCWRNVQNGMYEWIIFWGFLLSALSTAFIIIFADNRKHDYYFTALLDGTIIFQFLILYCSMKL